MPRFGLYQLPPNTLGMRVRNDMSPSLLLERLISASKLLLLFQRMIQERSTTLLSSFMKAYMQDGESEISKVLYLVGWRFEGSVRGPDNWLTHLPVSVRSLGSFLNSVGVF